MSISLCRFSHRTTRSSARQTARPSVLQAARLVLRFILSSVFVLAPAAVARAQAVAVTRLDRQLERVDLAVSAAGLFNSSTNGTNYLGDAITDDPGNTVGALATVRYTVKPFVGFEFNYGYARFTQNYSNIGGVQSNANEYTVGYVVHPADLFGVHPFVAIGAGSISNKPTPGGGQGLLTQARAGYYYALGADGMLTEHFGARVQFRQTLSLAPDYGQNYLTIKQRTISSQPAIGFFYKF